MLDPPSDATPRRLDGSPHTATPFSGGVARRDAAPAAPADPFARVQTVPQLGVSLRDGIRVEIERATPSVVARDPSGSVQWRLAVGPDEELLSAVHATAWGEDIAIVDRSAGVVLVYSRDGVLLGRMPEGAPMLAPSDALAAPDGTLLVVDTPAQTIHRLHRSGVRQDLVRASLDGSGAFNGPGGIARHDQELLITDLGGARILRYTFDGQPLGTFGSRADGLVRPRAITVDAGGRVLVADPVAGAVFAYADGALVARWVPAHHGPGWTSPWQVATSPDGQLLVVTS